MLAVKCTAVLKSGGLATLCLHNILDTFVQDLSILAGSTYVLHSILPFLDGPALLVLVMNGP